LDIGNTQTLQNVEIWRIGPSLIDNIKCGGERIWRKVICTSELIRLLRIYGDISWATFDRNRLPGGAADANLLGYDGIM
jgi:hypothetical protein